MPNTTYIALIPLLPLAGFLLLGLFGRSYFKKTSGIIGTTLLLISTVLALYTAYGYFFEYGKLNGVYQKLIPLQYTWLEFAKGVSIDMGIILDPISAMMLVVVSFVSLMVHIYSLAYMKGEERFPTYYAFLGLWMPICTREFMPLWAKMPSPKVKLLRWVALRVASIICERGSII